MQRCRRKKEASTGSAKPEFWDAHRIEQGLGKLASFVPGGQVTEHHWKGDTLSVAGEAMGQRVASRLTVCDDSPRQAYQGGPKLPE